MRLSLSATIASAVATLAFESGESSSGFMDKKSVVKSYRYLKSTMFILGGGELEVCVCHVLCRDDWQGGNINYTGIEPEAGLEDVGVRG